MERAHRHKGYDITLTSSKEVAGWVPAAIIKSAPMQPHRDEWTIRETSRPQPSQEGADRIALDQAMASIDGQANRPKNDMPRNDMRKPQFGAQPKPMASTPNNADGMRKPQFGGQPKPAASTSNNPQGRKK
jgi:hypothetical protein